MIEIKTLETITEILTALIFIIIILLWDKSKNKHLIKSGYTLGITLFLGFPFVVAALSFLDDPGNIRLILERSVLMATLFAVVINLKKDLNEKKAKGLVVEKEAIKNYIAPLPPKKTEDIKEDDSKCFEKEIKIKSKEIEKELKTEFKTIEAIKKQLTKERTTLESERLKFESKKDYDKNKKLVKLSKEKEDIEKRLGELKVLQKEVKEEKKLIKDREKDFEKREMDLEEQEDELKRLKILFEAEKERFAKRKKKLMKIEGEFNNDK